MWLSELKSEQSMEVPVRRIRTGVDIVTGMCRVGIEEGAESGRAQKFWVR